MNAIDVFKEQIQGAHEIVEGTIEGVTEEQAQKSPGGIAHPIGATYLHTLISEDFIVNMMVRGTQPLLMGDWAGKTGASEPPPPPGGDTYAWACRVKVDLGQARQYAQAVYKNTLDYVGSLGEADLGREIDVPGFGKHSLAYYLTVSAVIHPSNHIGEVSAIKGVFGAKGYPF